MRKQFSIASFVCLPLIACGGSDNNTKTVVLHDAKTFMDAPMTVATCKSMDSYPGFVASTKQSVDDYPAMGSNDHYQNIQGLLGSMGSGSAQTLDILSGYLFQDMGGSGAFGAGIKAGTYNIDPTMDSTIQIFIWPQLPASTTTLPADYIANETYLAFAGSLVLNTEGSAGSNVSGSMSNLDFVHVIQSGTTLMGANDDGSGNSCETTIGSLTFTAVATAGRIENIQPTGISDVSAPHIVDAPALLRHRFVRN